MSNCTTCLDPDGNCCDPLYGTYSLVGDPYWNDVAGFGPDCPKGFVCGPTGGDDPNEPPWDPPGNPPGCPGGGCANNQGGTLVLASCSGNIVRSIPYGITQFAYNAIVAEMLEQRHQNQLACDDFPNQPRPAVVKNDVQCVGCPGGDPVTLIGTLPKPYLISGGQLCIPAGVYPVSTTYPTKALLNAHVLDLVTQELAQGISDGFLSCAQVCNDGSTAKIDGYFDAIFGDFGGVPQSAYLIANDGCVSASGSFPNPPGTIWNFVNGNLGGWYIFTNGRFANIPSGVNVGSWFSYDYCTATDYPGTPVISGACFAQARYSLILSSGVPQWDGTFVFTDPTSSGYCAYKDLSCKSAGGTNLAYLTVTQIDPTTFELAIAFGADASNSDILWVGTLSPSATPNSAYGTYVKTGGAATIPATIDIVSGP